MRLARNKQANKQKMFSVEVTEEHKIFYTIETKTVV
jgi:hypothetical protein